MFLFLNVFYHVEHRAATVEHHANYLVAEWQRSRCAYDTQSTVAQFLKCDELHSGGTQTLGNLWARRINGDAVFCNYHVDRLARSDKCSHLVNDARYATS